MDRKKGGLDDPESNETPEYRIYASSRGNRAVRYGIKGNEDLASAIATARQMLPNDTLYVREVFESVILVYEPGKPPVTLPSSGS